MGLSSFLPAILIVMVHHNQRLTFSEGLPHTKHCAKASPGMLDSRECGLECWVRVLGLALTSMWPWHITYALHLGYRVAVRIPQVGKCLDQGKCNISISCY